MREGNIAVVVVAIVLVLLFFGLLGGGMMGWGMMGGGHMWGWDGDGWSPWWGLGMMVIWLLTIVAVIFGIAWFIRQGTSSDEGRRGSSDQALDTLRERYARGEITKEEFDRMRQDLE